MARASSSAWSKPRSRRRRGMDRHPGDEVSARPAPCQRSGEGSAERRREAPFAAVLELMQGGSDRAAEARAPLELQDPDRHRQPRSPSGHPAGSSTAPPERRRAGGAQDLTFAARSPGQRRRQEEVDERLRIARRCVARAAYPAIERTSSALASDPRGQAARASMARSGRPAAHAVCSARVPAGSSMTALAPRTVPDHAAPGGQVRSHRDDAAGAVGRLGCRHEQRVDREAHEQHVDAVRRM